MLQDARRSADALAAVCSFDALPRTDYADLNWWPVLLERAWRLLGHDLPADRAFRGDDTEVNPDFRGHRDTVFDHPVVSLEPDAVARVAGELAAITPAAVRALVPAERSAAVALLGTLAAEFDLDFDLAGELAEQHRVTRDFYAGAAERGLAVVLWWD
ncbi:hypothetical protein BJP25_20190 [Actinokineospora bangkokensis]|uniref:DUF1877 domain-containing protein n=1 Tax=Actinokineospora bangkokensis TaxID=1193682 RepID=A0A1Q9LK96_9PSEU|nr:hypothetical protein BJP25_20190 [Actinokineospora bangkokensis]